jgi:hypothetical protein
MHAPIDVKELNRQALTKAEETILLYDKLVTELDASIADAVQKKEEFASLRDALLAVIKQSRKLHGISTAVQ